LRHPINREARELPGGEMPRFSAAVEAANPSAAGIRTDEMRWRGAGGGSAAERT
jgi:hypothetical protein